MGLINVLFGRPLASSEDEGERISPNQGIPTFGLDALSSAAYGPEAALTILLPLGLLGVQYVVPLTFAVIGLLVIVFFSYRQTIAAYPNGGGSYTVARENLGAGAGLLAGAALMIDYLLNVAVGISAGIGALVSAVPSLLPHTLALCLLVLAILTMVNLRGVKEAGTAFIAPTYLFVGTLAIVIVIGLYKVIVSGGHPLAVTSLAPQQTGQTPTVQLVDAWILVKAFASGCTALTGVEAVSNGVQAFKKPVVPAARATLTAIIAILIFLLAGIAVLVRYYGIMATDPGAPGYQSILSLLTAAVTGKGVFYDLTMFSVLLVLCLSANTSFADFPRLCRMVARDDYLPHSLTTRGRRLVFSQGIWGLSILAALLLILFGGVTDRLIPLFAVGAFMAFTLSQAGMVGHWRRVAKGFSGRMVVNAIGALATGATTIVILVAKFAAGAWVVVLLLPALLVFMGRIHRHYRMANQEVALKDGMELSAENLLPPIVLVPVDYWNAATEKALQFAMTLSPDVQAIHVTCDADCDRAPWSDKAPPGARLPKLVTLPSPFRLIIHPIVDYVLKVEKENPSRTVAVVIASMVERHWYHYFLHNQRGQMLTALLLLAGDERINIINVPWYLKA
ncbi:MAG: APC family permease [Terriglobales bacterium]